MSNFLGGFASESVLPVIDGVKVFVGDMAYTIVDGGFWNAVQPTAPPGANPAWAFVDVLRGSPGPQGESGVGEAGPQGQIGPPGIAGARGPQGPAGKNAFSYTSQVFQVPAISATPFPLTVTDTSWMVAGQLVYIPGAGTFTIVGQPSGNLVQLANSGDPNNMPVGTQVQAGASISPANLRGPAGPQGNPGPQGPPGPQGVSGTSAYSTLAQTLTVPAANASVTAFVVSAASFGVGQIVYISGGDYFSVTGVNTTNNTLTVTNLGYPGGAAPGTVLPIGATVSGTGPQGPQGVAGPAGPQGPQGLAGLAPTGSIAMFAGVTPPGGWLICDGSVQSESQYPGLYSVISNLYNTGGETAGQFRLPNLQSRFPLGASADGTTYPLASTGGEAAHTLSVAEMPVHNHTDSGHTHTSHTVSHNHSDSGHQHTYDRYILGAGPGTPSGTVYGNNWTTGTSGVGYAQISTVGDLGTTTSSNSAVITNTGGGAAHNNMPPYLTINFIIKT